MKHIPLKTVSLRGHQLCNEVWLQEIIADDPKILGLGDLILKDRERRHPNAGRLDLLLQEVESPSRYEVEIQLGSTDESHIIRTIEYWDLERRRYPQYDHTAVIVAEDITSRFLNVISLFNGFIPIIALQLSAIETPDGIGLHFTKVLDTVRLGLIDEDEPISETTDRTYWETRRGTPQTVTLADEALKIAQEFAPTAQLSYNKHYIGFRVEGRACNFAVCTPQRSGMRLSIQIPKSDEVDQKLEAAELDLLDYESQWRRYRIKIKQSDFAKHRALLKELMLSAYQQRNQ